MTAEPCRDEEAVSSGDRVDNAVMIRRHFVQPAPAEDQLQVAEFRQSPNNGGHELVVESFEIAPESESRGLIRLRFCDDDLVAGRGAPMHTIRIDDHRKFVRPWPRPRTPTQLLP